MKRAILIAAALTLALSAGAYAALPTYTWVTQAWDNFEGGTVGNALVGTTGAGGTYGTWAGDASLDEMQIADDGTGNKAVKAHQRNGGTGARYAWLFGSSANATQGGTVNRLSFRAKLIGNTSTRSDKGITVQWASNTVLANGRSDGTGVQLTQASYLAEAGWGSQSSGSAPPNSWYGTYNAASAGWDTYDMIMYRDGSNKVEWYINGTLFATKTDLTEYVAGPAAGGGPRYMEDIELFVVGKDISGLSSFYIDDVSIQYDYVPEPSSLVAFATFSVGAFGLMRRRRA